jgi:PIN domain nuclease of toxin-antitoxin system
VEKQQVLNIMKKSVEHKTRVLIFSTISVWNILILRRIQGEITINLLRSRCDVAVILVRS